MKTVLPQDAENQLAQYCMVMIERLYGLRSSYISQLVFQLALKDKLKHPFSVDKGMAGRQ